MLTEVIKITELKFEENPDNDIDKLVNLIKNFEITEIASDLNENIKCVTKGKYFFLSVLRDVFIEFKKKGDTELLFSKGQCNKNCYNNCPTAYQFMGNNSKETFAFVVDDTTNSIKELHFCVGFIDENGVKGDNYYGFMVLAAIKLAEMKKGK